MKYEVWVDEKPKKNTTKETAKQNNNPNAPRGKEGRGMIKTEVGKIETVVDMWLHKSENDGRTPMCLKTGYNGTVEIYKDDAVAHHSTLNALQFRQMLECGRAIAQNRTVLILGGEVK